MVVFGDGLCRFVERYCPFRAWKDSSLMRLADATSLGDVALSGFGGLYRGGKNDF